MSISIHAPTNGATVSFPLISSISDISIHAPTNGATHSACICYTAKAFQSTLRRTERLVFVGVIADCIYFNPRSDERSDVHYNHQLHTLPISIHAPTNGATKKVIGCSFSGKFQSTLRRTERRTHVCDRSCHSYFNPRSDERSDGEVQTAFCTFYISIHAPTNGATAILHKKMKKTIQNRLIILLFSTNSLRLLCSCTQYSFFLFIFHGANDLVILCSLSFRTTSKN